MLTKRSTDSGDENAVSGEMALQLPDTCGGFLHLKVCQFPQKLETEVVDSDEVVLAVDGVDVCSSYFPRSVSDFMAHESFLLLFG